VNTLDREWAPGRKLTVSERLDDRGQKCGDRSERGVGSEINDAAKIDLCEKMTWCEACLAVTADALSPKAERALTLQSLNASVTWPSKERVREPTLP